MRQISASEASRNFSRVLDSAEHGERVVITRAGRRVAVIGPAPEANGAALRQVFDRWRGNAALDDAFAANVAAAQEAVSAEEDADPWRG